MTAGVGCAVDRSGAGVGPPSVGVALAMGEDEATGDGLTAAEGVANGATDVSEADGCADGVSVAVCGAWVGSGVGVMLGASVALGASVVVAIGVAAAGGSVAVAGGVSAAGVSVSGAAGVSAAGAAAVAVSNGSAPDVGDGAGAPKMGVDAGTSSAEACSTCSAPGAGAAASCADGATPYATAATGATPKMPPCGLLGVLEAMGATVGAASGGPGVSVGATNVCAGARTAGATCWRWRSSQRA
jgi:hypothetical protein